METTQQTQSKTVKFVFAGKMAKLLGRQSVSSEIVALFELVKNAYDADSPKVKVVFEDVPGTNGRIIVKDFGDGMTEDDIQNKWLVIGTDSKEKAKFTKRGRRVVGEKGIGRFATERLAHKVTLTSCPKDSTEALELKIDWDQYEEKDARFENVQHVLITRPRSSTDEDGLQIVLENLRDEWTQKKIDALSSQLSALVIPRILQTDHPFEIELIAPNFNVKSAKIESDLLDKAPYKLKAIFYEDRILMNGWIKGEKVIGQHLDNHRIPNVPLKCGRAVLHYYAFPRDPALKKDKQGEWEKYYGPKTLDKINEMLESHAGIRLYRDGFRVKPYGDPGNDWTHRAEKARGQSGVQPNNRTVGWVEITSEKNSQIVDTTTREKVIENEAFQDLVAFIDLALKKFNAHIAKSRRPLFKRKPRQVSEKADDLKVEVETSNLSPEEKVHLEKGLDEIAEDAREEARQAKEIQEVLMSQIEAYRNLASLGIMTGAVSHEVRHDLSHLLISIEDVLETEQNGAINLQSLDIHDVYNRVMSINEHMQMVRGFTSALKSKSDRFRRKEPLNLYETVEKTLAGFSGVFTRWNIQPVNSVPVNMPEITMFKSDLQTILINFVTNSIKGIKSKIANSSGQDFGSQTRDNFIKVSANIDPNYFIFSVSDNGIGIHPDIRDHIFDIFVSYNEEDESGQSGSGLGLTLVKEVVENHGGTVFVDKPEFDQGATLTVKIPLSRVRKNNHEQQ